MRFAWTMLFFGLVSLPVQARPVLVPPQPLTRVDATYPPSAAAARREGRVELLVTVDENGRVARVEVGASGGKEFDLAAVAAVRQWRFRPALQDGKPVASRIRIPFRFALPVPAPSPTPAPSPAPASSPVAAPTAASAPSPSPASSPAPGPSPAPAPAPWPSPVPAPTSAPPPPKDEEKVVDVTVRGQRKPPPRALSDFVLDREALAVAPRQTAADLLSSAPGIYVSRPEGDAVAHEVFLRGFDAAHGQDIEFTLGPLPLNQVSHIHGQGYADLNFIIPELVRSLRVTEGVYDPRQGDFAVAGSVDFDLGVAERGYQLRTAYGSFNTFRQLLLWAPRGEADDTFAAAQVRKSDGFGQNRGSLSGGGIAQYGFDGPAGFRGRAQVAGYGARASLAGVLRLDDVRSGIVDFYGSYPDPSANAQSAFAARAHALLSLERPTSGGARTGIAFWLLFSQYRSRENFTGYTQRSQFRPEWVGRGDLIEQSNRDMGLGARAYHRTPRWRPTSWASGSFELGLSLRTHFIDQAQNLLQAPQNETWDRRVDASLLASDVGAYLDADWSLTRHLRLRGGVRADVLYYDIDDRLGNFLSGFDRQSHIVGFRRTALGVAFGPRAAVEVLPLDGVQVMVAYGQGYRSPQARQLDEGESAPFAKVSSFEGGLQLRPFGGQRLVVKLAAFLTTLSQDIAFDPEQGSLEKIGPTTRVGFMGQLAARPWPWLFASLSVTYVRATLDEPPPATAENPSPAFQPGQRLPFVPPVVVRFDLGAHREIARFGGGALTARAGLGLSHIASRPLPFDRAADPFTLVDLSASLRWRWVEIGVEIFNLLDARFAQSEFSFVSDWRTREYPSRVPARHVSAGPPATAMTHLTLYF